MHELRLFFTALQFFTRVPVPAWVGWSPAQLNASARHFPTVGWLVGGLSGSVLALAGWAWPPLVAALLATAAGIWLTGAFHEDGLADSCDGFGGAQTAEKVLAIMKDSRIGSYGAVGLMLVLGLKVALLAELLRQHPPLAWASLGAVMAALLSAHALSRWAALLVMARLGYVREDALSKSRPIAQGVSLPALLAATVLALLPGLLLGAGVTLLLGWAAAGLVGALAIRFCRRRLGGYVGDALGATQQLAELAVLLAWTLQIRGAPWP